MDFYVLTLFPQMISDAMSYSVIGRAVAEGVVSVRCVDIRDFDPNSLAERFALMVARAEEIKTHMATKLSKNRRLLGDQFDELFRPEGVRIVPLTGRTDEMFHAGSSRRGI